MSMKFNPASSSISAIDYLVSTTGDQFFPVTTGFGDNPDSGTMAQRLAACKVLSPKGAEKVA